MERARPDALSMMSVWPLPSATVASAPLMNNASVPPSPTRVSPGPVNEPAAARHAVAAVPRPHTLSTSRPEGHLIVPATEQDRVVVAAERHAVLAVAECQADKAGAAHHAIGTISRTHQVAVAVAEQDRVPASAEQDGVVVVAECHMVGAIA